METSIPQELLYAYVAETSMAQALAANPALPESR